MLYSGRGDPVTLQPCSPRRALPTETKVESGTSRSKDRTSVNLENIGFVQPRQTSSGPKRGYSCNVLAALVVRLDETPQEHRGHVVVLEGGGLFLMSEAPL